MRTRILFLSLFISSISIAQVVFTNDQLIRLANAGKVWGYLKFHHPFLQYKDINWDSAFIVSVPGILQAHSKEEYEASIEKFLGVLNDPVTTVIKRSRPTQAIKLSNFVIEDSIMIITHYDDRVIDLEQSNTNLANKVKAALNKANAVIFDLRPDRETFMANDGPTVFQSSLWETGILSNLFKGSVSMPATRAVLFKTFISETAQDNSGYNSPFSIERRKKFIGRAEKNLPIVFIINKYSTLPLEAVGLQIADKAIIIQEEFSGETGIVPDVKFYITDSVLIRSRLAEIIHDEKGIGFIPNEIISVTNTRDPGIKTAIDILKNRNKLNPFLPVRNFSGFTITNPNKSSSKNPYPALGERMLALAKIYSVLKYFYPNKHLWTHNWDSTYMKFLPQFIYAKDSVEYLKAVVEMYSFLQDGHGIILQKGAPVSFRNATGISPPFQVRIVENELVVTHIIIDSLAKSKGIKVGDIILEKDGRNSMKDINESRKFFSASNYDAQSGQIASRYLRNPAGTTVNLKIKDAKGKTSNISLNYLQLKPDENRAMIEFNEKGNTKPVMYFVTKEIGYVNLGVLKENEVDSMFTLFKNTKAIIFDVRPYPRSSSIYLIAPRLGLRYGGGKNLPGTDLDDLRDNKSRGWIYKGKTICLIHENTQSAGETVAGILYNSILVGNHTAGANGGVVHFFIPGDIRLTFTGTGVKGQGMGIQPHIPVKLTIKGIQEGKDEILERAIRFVENGK